MNEQLLQEESANKRIRWLIIYRIAIVTFLLGITTIKVQKAELLEISLAPLYVIFALTYILSVLFLLHLRFFKNIRLNIYIQALTDTALITGLVYVTGGIRSIYSPIYPLVIIYSVLFLERRGGLITASAASIFYGLLLDLEYFGIIRQTYTVATPVYEFGAGYVFSRIIIHILSFYIIALLASFVVAQEKKARLLLAEKVTAFDQLDLLHRSIIESVDTGIMTVNLQGRIKSFNRAAEEISGFTFGEVENRDIGEVFPDFIQIREKIIKDDYKSPARGRYNLELSGKDNKKLILGCSLSTLKDHKGKRIGAIVIFQDLTSIIQMEKALEKSRRLAIIGEMAAGLAHEMRNPLASLSGSIQILRKDLILNPVDERLMQIILRGKDQLENIIRDFLLLARPAPGKHDNIRIKEVIEDVVESVKLVPDWNDNIRVNLSLTDSLTVKANRTEMREVMWNLILNAVQAMPDGGILTIEAKNTLPGHIAGDYMEIKVSDTGCGIEEKYADNIFEPFFTTKETGTGLGLAIVNRIVEGYAGTIRIENNMGEGITCTVSLPVYK